MPFAFTHDNNCIGAAEAFIAPGLFPGNRLFLDRRGEQRVVHRQAHGVETPCGHRIDVGLGDVVVAPGLLERAHLFLADQIGDARFDRMLGALAGHFQHVAFLQHPATEADAAQQHRLPGFADDLAFMRTQEPLRLRVRQWRARDEDARAQRARRPRAHHAAPAGAGSRGPGQYWSM